MEELNFFKLRSQTSCRLSTWYPFVRHPGHASLQNNLVDLDTGAQGEPNHVCFETQTAILIFILFSAFWSSN